MNEALQSKGSNDGELAARKKVTFEQAEGLESLPEQLKPREISQQMRAYLWATLHENLSKHIEYPSMGGSAYFREPWKSILKEKHIVRDHLMADEFSNDAGKLIRQLKRVYVEGDYSDVLGLTQWIVRRRACPSELPRSFAAALIASQSAYRLFDNDTIAPISDQHEAAAFTAALANTAKYGFEGPRKHLRDAAQELTDGNWASSIRESINAVEAVARIIEPDANNLGPALTALERKHPMHKGLRNGFTSLYGFTSDENGIRHALLEKGDANVDAVDAQYMLGACAAFVSYLLARARAPK